MARMRHKPHPAYKAPELMQLLVRLITPDRTIIDPYMGSGTTLVACLREGHAGIGIEIERVHFETACRLLQKEVEKFGLFA